MKKSDTEQEKKDAEQVVKHFLSDEDAAQLSKALNNTPTPTNKAIEASLSFKKRISKFD